MTVWGSNVKHKRHHCFEYFLRVGGRHVPAVQIWEAHGIGWDFCFSFNSNIWFSTLFGGCSWAVWQWHVLWRKINRMTAIILFAAYHNQKQMQRCCVHGFQSVLRTPSLTKVVWLNIPIYYILHSFEPRRPLQCRKLLNSAISVIVD